MRNVDEILDTSGMNCRSTELAKIKERIPIASKKLAVGPASITSALCHVGLLSKVLTFCSGVKGCIKSNSCSAAFSV